MSSQSTRPTTATTMAGQTDPTATAAADRTAPPRRRRPGRRSVTGAVIDAASAARSRLRPRSAPRTSVTAAKKPASARVASPRSAEVDRDDVGDPARPRRHHHDAVGQEHRLGDRVGDEDDRRAGLARRCAAARPACARGSSRRGRRTARPSAGAAGRRPAPGRWRPAAACRRTAAPGGARRSRPGATSSSSSRDRSRRSARVPAGSSSGSSTLRRDRAPVEEPGLLERDPVVVVEPGLRAGLPSTSTVPAVGVDQVADQAQQRRLAAAGRPDQRDELARRDVRSMPVSAVTSSVRPGLKTLSTPVDGDRRRWSWRLTVGRGRA